MTSTLVTDSIETSILSAYYDEQLTSGSNEAQSHNGDFDSVTASSLRDNVYHEWGDIGCDLPEQKSAQTYNICQGEPAMPKNFISFIETDTPSWQFNEYSERFEIKHQALVTLSFDLDVNRFPYLKVFMKYEVGDLKGKPFKSCKDHKNKNHEHMHFEKEALDILEGLPFLLWGLNGDKAGITPIEEDGHFGYLLDVTKLGPKLNLKMLCLSSVGCNPAGKEENGRKFVLEFLEANGQDPFSQEFKVQVLKTLRKPSRLKKPMKRKGSENPPHSEILQNKRAIAKQKIDQMPEHLLDVINNNFKW